MAVHKLAMHIYREFRSELHRKYKQLLGEGHDPKQYPPDPQRAAQWISMIEHRWETTEWKLQSERNSMSRRQVKTTHTSGSQSFAQRLSITPADEAPSSQAELYRQQHWSKKKNKWITPHAEATHQRLELGLSQSEVSGSPVAQQRLIDEVLGKRVARRQGYRSRGPSSISSSTVVATEVSSLPQQLSESQRRQEELRQQCEESQKAQEDLRRQCEEAQKGQEDLRQQQQVMQDQAATQASQIQMLLQRVGLGSLGSTGN